MASFRWQSALVAIGLICAIALAAAAKQEGDTKVIRQWTVDQLAWDAVDVALLAHKAYVEPWKAAAAERLRGLAARANKHLRAVERPARAGYARWREIVVSALADSPLEMEKDRAVALADAGSLMVGTGALGLVGGALLYFVIG